jgi:phage tail sheath protein FI
LVNERKDCIGFLSAPLSLWRNSNDDLKKDSLREHKANLSNPTSYVIFDSSPVYVYNKYSDRFEWIPACGHMAGLCAYTDEIADAWFSPAGLNRGQLRGITKIAYNPKQVDRDELYNDNINPIVNMPGNGIVLWGDKTGQRKASAFDRINVRRLFIVLQRTCRDAAKFQLFELNDEFTRNSFINIVEPYLREVKGRRGITDFKIVCNEKNNTAQIIDSNQFVADIYIKPARSINYITLNFIATRTGVSFAEIGA